MKRPTNLKIGDMFRVTDKNTFFDKGEIVSLGRDDGSDSPYFWKEDKSHQYWIDFSYLEPVTKTARDAQVGDVVIGISGEHMVLERGQNTVLLSQANYFKKPCVGNYHFDELEEHFTLKAE